MFPQDLGRSPSDLQKLSDAREFQENDFINAQKKLRSIRAKLAILEGKLALTLKSVSFLIPLLLILCYIPTTTESSPPYSFSDAEKLLAKKQKRIDRANKALQFLCTTQIVWHNSASEVLLAGSFDGWTTQV